MGKRIKEKYVFYCHSIVFNGDSYKRHGLGGSESALIYMTQELARLGKEVTVFCKTDAPGVFDGVNYLPVDAMARYLRYHIIDVFISVRSPEIFQIPLKARQKVLWIHDAPDQPHLLSLKDEEITRRIDCYITISGWQTEELVRKFKIPREKIFLSRNGVHKKHFKHYRKKRKKRLVYTSTPFRGLEILLQVFPEIRKRVHDAELYVYSSMKVYGLSDTEDQERFGYIYDNCDQPGVTLVGSLPHKELARELMKAKVFVYPNIFSETSCIAAFEAQAAGLPVIASHRGALPETVEHAKSGYLIQAPADSASFKEQFVNSVVALLKDDDRWQQISRYARERVLKQYTWKQIAQEWVAFFNATRPTVSLCMIVKNEAHTIARCIQSVKPIVDEIVVVDTGSNDDTKTIAESLGAHVYDFEWQNNFAEARNFALEKVQTDWILVLDADEVISKRDLPKIRQLLNVSDAYRFFQRSYLNDPTVVGWKANDSDDPEGKGFAGYFDSPLTRLFRNKPNFRFEGAVHEVIEPSILREQYHIVNTDIPIHHYGKVVSKDYLQDKGRMYVEIGKAKIGNNPDDPRNYYDLGSQYFEMNKLSEAKECFEKAVAIDARYYRALCDLGLIYAKEENYSKARELLEKTTKINPHYTSAYINLGLVYEGLGDIDKAAGCFEKALERDPLNVQAHKHYGLVHFYRQDHEKAYTHFKHLKKNQALSSVKCEYSQVCHSIGLKAMHEHRFNQAEELFKESLMSDPSHVKAWNDLGIMYVKSGRLDHAEECFMKVIDECHMRSEYQKEWGSAYVNLGFLYNNKGEFKKAIDSLERALEIDPTDCEIYNHIGIAKCGLGLLADGIDFFHMTLKMNPDHSAAKVNLKRVKETFVQERNMQATDRKI